MEFRKFSELFSNIGEESRKEAKANYDKFYGKPFGHVDPILCSSSDDGEDFLTKVIVPDFE